MRRFAPVLLAVTMALSHVWPSSAAVSFGDNYAADVVIEYDPDLYDPEHNLQDVYELLFQPDVMEQILAEAGIVRDEYGNLIFPDGDWIGSVDIDLRPVRSTDDSDDWGSPPGHGAEEPNWWDRTSCTPASVEYQEGRPEVTIAKRPGEATVTYVGRETVYEITVRTPYRKITRTECLTEYGVGSQTIESKQEVHEDTEEGVTEDVASLDVTAPNRRWIDDRAFSVQWETVGSKNMTVHVVTKYTQQRHVIVLRDVDQVVGATSTTK